MKNTLPSMFFAAVLGSAAVYAADATSVRISVSKNPVPKVEKMGELPQAGMPGKSIMSAPSVGWQVVNVPISIKAKSKGDKSPDFVPSLTVHAYLVFESDASANKLVLLDKEITYVDIPVDAKSSGTSTGEAYVGLFISPSNARKINEKAKGDLKGKLKAVALEATFNGNNCMDPDAEPYVLLDPSLKNRLSGKGWWKRKAENAGAALSSVAETPYAPFIGTYYAATSPRFGAADASEPSTGSPAGGGGLTGGIPSASTDTASADSSAETSDDAADSSSASKKGKRDRRSRRSN